jgi:hypothetical protein
MQSSRVSWGVLEQVNLASDEFLETVKFNVDLQQLNLVDSQQLKMGIPLETPGLGKIIRSMHKVELTCAE